MKTKHYFSIAFLLIITTVYSQDFDFKKEMKIKNDYFTKIDSIKISQKKIVATFWGLWKSDGYNQSIFFDYLKKTDSVYNLL